MGKVFSVEGTSTVKPVNLPEGLTVKTEEVRDVVDVTAKSIFGTTFRVETRESEPDDYFPTVASITVKNGPGGTEMVRLMDRENVQKLRDALSATLGESRLRIVHDGEDSTGSSFRWIEVRPDRFTYSHIDTDPDTLECHNEEITFQYLVDKYGIRSVTYR